MRTRKKIGLLVLLLLTAALLCGCQGKPESAAGRIAGLEDLAGKKIGVFTGTRYDVIAQENIRDPKLEYINTLADCTLGLESGKIDAYLADSSLLKAIARENPSNIVLATLEEDPYGFVFPKSEKGAALREQFNGFLATAREDGTLDSLEEIWFGEDEALQTVDLDSLTGENGTLRFSTELTTPPFSYNREGKPVGYEVDLAARFCRARGYRLEVAVSDFSGLLAGVATGKSDFGGSTVSITEERKQSLYFSDPEYISSVVAVVRDGGAAGKAGGIAESFEKTFIRESRWRMFVSGIAVTLIITALSAIFGTALGFLLYLVYRKDHRIFNGALNALMDILEKTPVVVVLMILYYILFGSADLDGVWVAVIGFTVLFACGFVGTVHGGVRAVDGGQREAALALGFNDTKTFLSVILPQAARHFLPNYRGNIVALLKETAVVGYIAVQDLTKISDIVRSRTYEAFFPLIATAVIYFLLAWLLTLAIRRIEFSFEPRNRKPEKILKGVKTQ